MQHSTEVLTSLGLQETKTGCSIGGGGGNLISQQVEQLQQQLQEQETSLVVGQHIHGFKICEYFKFPRGLGAQGGGRLHSQHTEAVPADFEGSDAVTMVSHMGESDRE